MTKRFLNGDPTSTKKQKVNDNFDDLWGEDLDEGDVDDALELASQAFQQVSLAPGRKL